MLLFQTFPVQQKKERKKNHKYNIIIINIIIYYLFTQDLYLLFPSLTAFTLICKTKKCGITVEECSYRILLDLSSHSHFTFHVSHFTLHNNNLQQPLLASSLCWLTKGAAFVQLTESFYSEALKLKTLCPFAPFFMS